MDNNNHLLTKKLLITLLILILMLGACTSCGRGNTGQKNAGNSTGQQAEADKTKEDKNDPTEPTELSDEPYNPRSYIPKDSRFEPVQSNHNYDALTNSKQQLIYKCISYYAYSVTDETYEERYQAEPFVLSGNDYLSDAKDADMQAAYYAFCFDNPQVFWLHGYYCTIYNDRTEVKLLSSYSPTAIRSMQGELNAVLTALYLEIPDGLSQYELEKYMHDYIINACVYDEEMDALLKNDPDTDDAENARDDLRESRPSITNIYGVLCDGDAICSGYSAAFQLLCQCVGLDCTLINGYADENADFSSESSAHAWNAVKLDQDWYLVDTTWDDGENRITHYPYFNITTEQIAGDHFAETLSIGEDPNGRVFNYFLPECKGVKYNYYTYDNESVKITTLSGDVIGEAYLDALSNGKDTIELYFDPSCGSFDEVMQQMFDNDNDSIIHRCIDYVNEKSNHQYNRYRYQDYDFDRVIALQMEEE